jgi:AcrR family transcriptional regulator
MGRPKEHNEETRRELLGAAEKLLSAGGSEAVTVRRVADAAGTTTRAVYSLFGGIDGLYAALYAESFRTLNRYLDAIPDSDDPRSDLLRLGLEGFRPYALNHPNLFRLVFERIMPGVQPRPEDVIVGKEAFARLERRVRRCVEARLLPGRDSTTVAMQFHAACQGLASEELQGWMRPPMDAEGVWEGTLAALLVGLGRRDRKLKPRSSIPQPKVVRRPASRRE